jgi:cytochrome c biogenesis protein CcmG/thiol:disulfide interchange protein DsbE
MQATPHIQGNTRMTILIALCLFCLMSTVQANELTLGAPAPLAQLVTLDGQHISTRDLLGHTVILTFWATWCEPCQHELPLLSRFAKAHAAEGLKVLGFCLDEQDDLAQVRKLARQLGFPVGLLEQSTASGYGRMWRIPVSFVIDRKGVLRYDGWQVSRPAWNEASLNRVVLPLLSSEPNSNAKSAH